MTAGARRHTAGHTRQDTQKAAGRASGARTRNRQTHGSHGDGETEGDTTEYSRTQQETHGSHGTHNRQERTGSERDTDGIRRKRYDIYI